MGMTMNASLALSVHQIIAGNFIQGHTLWLTAVFRDFLVIWMLLLIELTTLENHLKMRMLVIEQTILENHLKMMMLLLIELTTLGNHLKIVRLKRKAWKLILKTLLKAKRLKMPIGDQMM